MSKRISTTPAPPPAPAAAFEWQVERCANAIILTIQTSDGRHVIALSADQAIEIGIALVNQGHAANVRK